MSRYVTARQYGKEVKIFIRFYINYIIKSDFFAYFYITFFVIFGEENIQTGFRGINLVPFNLETVISKLDVKLYISISIEPLSTEIDSWIFKIL